MVRVFIEDRRTKLFIGTEPWQGCSRFPRNLPISMMGYHATFGSYVNSSPW